MSSSPPPMPAVASRPDASMDLLNQILRQPVDPDYAVAAARGVPPTRFRLGLAAVLVVIGALFAVAALQTSRQAPVLQGQRDQLIVRIRAAERAQDRQRSTEQQLTEDITRLRAGAIGTDETATGLQLQINALEPVVGTVAVTGPGVVVVVDDAPAADAQPRNRVGDLDLQQLANGLWRSGAEAVAINGHRLSALTAIRSAGDAVTVDYRSLTRPYRVEAIGDPLTLEARFAESSGGIWWSYLQRNLGMAYDVRTARSLTLAGDAALVLHYATRVSR